MSVFVRRLLIGIWLCGLSLLFLKPFDAGGDFYHNAAAGKYVLTHGQFPHFDEFTFTATGKPWVAYAWGGGAIMHLVFQAAGPAGISILGMLLMGITLAILYKLLFDLSHSRLISLILLTFASPVLTTRFLHRPELFAYPLLSGILLIYAKRLTHPKLIWLLPVITLMWANLYGSSVLLGLGVLLWFTLWQLGKAHFRISRIDLTWFVSVILSFAASLCNPYGLSAIFYIFAIGTVAQYEGEWASLWMLLTSVPLGYRLVSQYFAIIGMVFIGTSLVVVTVTILRYLRHLSTLSTLGNYFFLLAYLVLPFIAFRQITFAVILALPALAMALSWPAKGKTVILTTISIVAAALLGISLWISPPGIKSTLPAELKDLLVFLGTTATKGRAFNHQTLGSVLQYYQPGKLQTFFDTRDDLFFGTSVVEDLSSKTLPQIIGKYKIDLVVADILADPVDYKELFYAPGWQIVYLNPRYLVAIPKSKAVGLSADYSFFDPYQETWAKRGSENIALPKIVAMAKKYPANLGLQLALNALYRNAGNIKDATIALHNISIPFGPTANFVQTQIVYQQVATLIATKKCEAAKKILDQTASALQHLLIVQLNSAIPSRYERAASQYWQKCTKDTAKADLYLEKYLARPDISPLEKRAAEEEAGKLSK